MSKTFRAPRRLASVAVAFAVFGALAACGDLTKPKPVRENFTDTLTLWAINGTPLSAPSGLWLVASTGVRIDASYGFDLAFDIDGQGKTTLYTVRAVAGGLSTAHSVGLQRSQTPFDELLEAPKSGFVLDTSFTATKGDVFAVFSTDLNACGGSYFSNQIYAKLEVLDIQPAARTVTSRFTVDPSCGYVSLAPSGLPNR